MVLFAVQTEDEGRFGVTASKKVGNAVVRARARRRLRELSRLRRQRAVVRTIELVANARRSCARAPWTALEQDFDGCLGQLDKKIRNERP